MLLVVLLTGLSLLVFYGGWRKKLCYAAATLFVVSLVTVSFLWNETTNKAAAA